MGEYENAALNLLVTVADVNPWGRARDTSDPQMHFREHLLVATNPPDVLDTNQCIVITSCTTLAHQCSETV